MIVKPPTNKFLTFNTSKPNLKLNKNNLCLPESFNVNLSAFFHYRITFVNSQHQNTIHKVILYSKPGLKLNARFKDFWYKKINPTQISYDKFG